MSLPATVGSATPAARAAAIASLQQLLGDRLSTAASILEGHGKDASYHPCVPPDAVAFARSTEEVSETVKICARHKVPLIPLWKRHRRRGQCRGAKGRGEPRSLADESDLTGVTTPNGKNAELRIFSVSCADSEPPKKSFRTSRFS